MSADLENPVFTDENVAREHLERVRWPNGPVCPHCGGKDRVAKMEGPSYRPGLHHCRECRRQFTATIGTIYERSHMPLHKWFSAARLTAAGKKGTSAHQLHRTLGLSYKSAWFMAHRLREAMAGAADDPGGLGGEGKAVEAGETYFGNKEEVTTRTKHGKPGLASKRPVVGLVERGGKARTFHVDRADSDTVKAILRRNANRKSELVTDESRLYADVGTEYARHGTVDHSGGEHVSFTDRPVHTNTIEGYFSIFKRGMKGVYQHCSEQHLPRYLAEFEFRHDTRIRLGVEDAERAATIVAGGFGKRLMYRRPDVSAYA
jgi:transposase-like protein